MEFNLEISEENQELSFGKLLEKVYNEIMEDDFNEMD